MATDVSVEQVLDEAESLLREGGPAALSMRRLADRLGCSYQVVYSRVGGKGDLAAALHARGFDALERVALTDRASSDGPGERVEDVAAGYVRFALADPLRFEVMFGAPLEGAERSERVRAVERASFQRCWVAPVRDWYAQRDVDRPRGAATALAWRLWAAVHGIALVHLAGHSSPTGDPVVEARRMVRLLLDASQHAPDERTSDPVDP